MHLVPRVSSSRPLAPGGGKKRDPGNEFRNMIVTETKFIYFKRIITINIVLRSCLLAIFDLIDPVSRL